MNKKNSKNLLNNLNQKRIDNLKETKYLLNLQKEISENSATLATLPLPNVRLNAIYKIS